MKEIRILNPKLIDESLGFVEDNISKGYSITTDSLNIKLNELGFVTKEGSDNLGKETSFCIGYFNTLKGALQRMLENEVLTYLCDDLTSLQARLELIEGVIKDVCNNLPYGKDNLKNLNKLLKGDGKK